MIDHYEHAYLESDVCAVNMCAYGHPIGVMANKSEMGINYIYNERFSRSLPHGGRRSPAVACWASDHWVVSSNPLRGKIRN